MAEALKVPMKKAIMAIDKYGNTSASSIPIAMYKAIEDGRIRRNHMVATCAFGAGITFNAAVFPMVGLPRHRI